MVKIRKYFYDKHKAWEFAQEVRKDGYIVTDYGVNDNHEKDQYWVEYIKNPTSDEPIKIF